jgi:hypothetical protein
MFHFCFFVIDTILDLLTDPVEVARKAQVEEAEREIKRGKFGKVKSWPLLYILFFFCFGLLMCKIYSSRRTRTSTS